MKVEVPEGLTVKFHHQRFLVIHEKGGERTLVPTSLGKHLAYAGDQISPHGGYTLARVLRGDEVVAVGVATCHVKDNYNKRIGRAISLGRALKALRE